MKRVQFFELHEQKWMPTFLKHQFVETLSLMLNFLRIYHGISPLFAEWIKKSGGEEVFDFASGGAGPIETFLSHFKEQRIPPPRFVLSDLFPDEAQFQKLQRVYPDHISSIKEPVNALKFLKGKGGDLRSIIATFHHFKLTYARAILINAVENSNGIFIVEPFQRTPLHLVLGPLSIFPVLLVSLRRDLVKLIFSFIIPVIPFIIIFDTIVSILRCYSQRELAEMISSLPKNDFQWQIGSTRFMGIFKTTYLFGWKRCSSK